MRKRRVMWARVLAWSLWAMAVPLTALTVASVWGNMWIAWSDKTLSAFHGQVALRWGFSNPRVQNLAPGMHVRWFQPGWQWFRPLVDVRAFTAVNVPMWLLALVLVAVAVVATRRARAIRFAGHCRKCGYDLAGLGTRTTCPECGRPFAHQSRAA